MNKNHIFKVKIKELVHTIVIPIKRDNKAGLAFVMGDRRAMRAESQLIHFFAENKTYMHHYL